MMKCPDDDDVLEKSSPVLILIIKIVLFLIIKKDLVPNPVLIYFLFKNSCWDWM